MKTTKKQEAAAVKLLEYYCDTMRRLKAPEIVGPTKPAALVAILPNINSKTGKWRKTKNPKAPESAKLLYDLVKFHDGNGSLWGYPWFADPVERDALDTLAMILLGGSSAADAWRKVFRGK